MQMDIGYDLLNRKFTPQELQQVTHYPKLLMELPVYLILSNKIKRNKRLVKLFNKGLKQLKDSGKYDQYFEDVENGYYARE